MNPMLTDILRTLIGFPTVSHDSNLDLITWIENYLNGFGVPHWRVNEQPGKASLIARIGPDAEGGIVLSGHTDVVPVKDQHWATDPFTLIDTDEKFFGRGTSDMKSFIALALAHLPAFLSQPLTKPIWLAFSHDEEIGCLGAAPIALALNEKNAKPALVIIGEPTSMQLVGAHKGILSYETIITGREAHSSMPEQGVNAVMLMAELMVTLNRIADASCANPQACDFITPYSSVHIGVVEGGTARNIIPARARIAWEVRPLPGENVETMLAPYHAKVAELDAIIKARFPDGGIVTRELTNVRGLTRDDAYLPLASHLTQCNACNAVAFGTEGGIFQAHGLPAIICGPGSIDQAHQPNEFVTHTQLALGEALMDRIAGYCQS